MIYGNLKNKTQVDYLLKNDNLMKIVFDFLEGNKKNALEKGKFFIEDSKLFGFYSEYKTHTDEQQIWEAHRKYLDIQFLVSGQEIIEYSDLKNMSIAEEYSDETDAVLGTCDKVDYRFKMEEESFLILFPEEAHLPGVTGENESINQKIVIKIPID